jgi:glycosyltransferase involved in cell wall biosynthesis
MKIGIDARFWNQTGIGRYIRNVVGELAKIDTENEYVVFLLDEDFDSVSLPKNFRKVKTKIRWHSLSEQVILPLIYLREGLDLLYVPHFNVPILYPKKFVTTIHDLTVLRVRTGQVTTLPYPVYLIKYLAAFLVHLFAIKRAKKIFTVSKFVEEDLVKTFKVSKEKISLTPCAAEPSFHRRSEEEISRALEKYQVKKPYVFYVGNAYPHKNLNNLIEAFGLVAKDTPELTLVLGGKKNFFYERLEKECKDLDFYDCLNFVGFVSDADLPALYSGAALFVNPSLYEGFGIQVLEAFGCGCKVACSNTTSLPEVGGVLARYFNPRDPKDTAKVISYSLVINDPEFLQKAPLYIKNYSWSKSAQTVLETFKSL